MSDNSYTSTPNGNQGHSSQRVCALQCRHNERDGVSNHQLYDCSTVYSGAIQRKYQRSASLSFVRGIHRWPVNSPHRGPATRKMFPFDDVITWAHNSNVVQIRIAPEAQLLWHVQHCDLIKSLETKLGQMHFHELVNRLCNGSSWREIVFVCLFVSLLSHFWLIVQTEMKSYWNYESVWFLHT